jgi:ubiquinone/menaquinone biosynthesis C-methylase UbiE
MLRRVPSDEILDGQSVPRLDMERSLRDLRRINRWLGGIRIYRLLVRRFHPVSVLDLGTGTADLLESVDASMRVGLDFRIEHLSYLRSHRHVYRVVGDAARLPFRNAAFDLVTSAHFFHHFSPDENVVILSESMRVARRGVAVNDTRRSVVPFLFVKLVGWLRLVGAVTRADAPASVRQAYTAREALAIGRRVAASRAEAFRIWPFRLALLLWK